MTKKPTTLTKKFFDYNALPDKTTRATLRSEATAIKAAVKRTHDNIIEIGNRLQHAKDVTEHGQFMAWIDAELHMEYRTAKRFLEVSEAFGKIDNLSNLTLPTSALYMLAAPSVSEETREVAIEMAAAGELNTVADTKALIEASKPPAAPAVEAEKELAPEPIEDDEWDDSDPFDDVPNSTAPVPTPPEIMEAMARDAAAIDAQDAPESFTEDNPVEVQARNARLMNELDAETNPEYFPDVDGLDGQVGEINDGVINLPNLAVASEPEAQTPPPSPAKPEKKPEPTVEEIVDELPLMKALALYGHNGHIFRQDALFCLEHKDAIGKLSRKINGDLRHKKGNRIDVWKLAIQNNDPSLWEGCPACKGSLRFGERRDPCNSCNATGYTTRKDEGVSANVVATYAEEFQRS